MLLKSSTTFFLQRPLQRLVSHVITIISILALMVTADFPLENPCIQSCNVDELKATVLQQCIDKCKTLGHCCGNRLNGECPASSNQRLSCANGCEIAYHRSTKWQCKQDCANGNMNGCEYNHPNIMSTFHKCGDCQEGCDKWPDLNACEDGCELAATLPQFYQYVDTSDASCSNQDNIPRFLFAGQSNMVCMVIPLLLVLLG